MELKSPWSIQLTTCGFVSIVPLWNWNVSCSMHCIHIHSFNRTFMELKSRRGLQVSRFGSCFNRTFMELKSKRRLIVVIVQVVSIVPLWNWNQSQSSKEIERMRFQSYLYGIEIEVSHIDSEPCLPFQSYLYGIEIQEVDTRQLSLNVSIVPLWNWNDRHSLLYMEGSRFNRTFMELK